ncbi:hypothetical protein C5B89_08060 [Haloferax sp. Atlit-47N]|nr:hypothetical protein DEQ67_17480 [Haloferax sp. Atlit-48N]RDZ36629.1 hypothetical protein C5B88_00595 [Haloferax sp. Atlit-24N]RDZ41881.1 hypothetical protein C5B89_08060 [Haloferax sp. Atlit-47N]RLM37427.1 hypothetical protein DVK03_00595 [Haloferax sp. Atlit-109R]RLM45367.1 hypothetical protein DVK04_00595 [Haloferax sp. Atlit-105R]
MRGWSTDGIKAVENYARKINAKKSLTGVICRIGRRYGSTERRVELGCHAHSTPETGPVVGPVGPSPASVVVVVAAVPVGVVGAPPVVAARPLGVVGAGPRASRVRTQT